MPLVGQHSSANLPSSYFFLALSFTKVKLGRQPVCRPTSVVVQHITTLLLLLNLLQQHGLQLLQLSTVNCRTATRINCLPLLCLLLQTIITAAEGSQRLQTYVQFNHACQHQQLSKLAFPTAIQATQKFRYFINCHNSFKF